MKKYEYTLYRTKSIVDCWGLARSSYLGCGGVIAIASWWFVNLGRSGRVMLLLLLVHVYRIRRNRRMALCIAGIVGRRPIDIASDFPEREIIQCVLFAALVCGLYLDASTGGMGIRWVSFTLLVSPLRHIQHTQAGRSEK